MQSYFINHEQLNELAQYKIHHQIFIEQMVFLEEKNQTRLAQMLEKAFATGNQMLIQIVEANV